MVRIFGEHGLTIRAKEPETHVSLRQNGDAFELEVIDRDHVRIVNRFDRLWEALDSLTGIVKTLEKEIGTICRSSSDS